VLILKIIWNLKNKIICYQSLRVNRIYSIVLSKSYQEVVSAVLEASKEGINGEVKRAEVGSV
jgi:hypothetical protein